MSSGGLSGAFEPRAVCARCRRPEKVCYCAHIAPIPTATRVVLLQHPRERDVPIGTARMASLCLPNSELHVGIDWSHSSELARALSDPARPAALLYPGDAQVPAIDVFTSPPKGPVTLVVIDGTWSLARKVVRENPRLRALPRFAFTPPAPSEYRIRREPHETYVSTIEALVYVLGALEGDAARFLPMLAPFRAMVDTQLRCAETLRGARVRHNKPKAIGPRVPLLFRERAGDLVCVVGEANAWPYRSSERGDGHPDELVQWVAYRPATGETFDLIARPRYPLAPSTPRHIRLGEDELMAGVTLQALHEAWRAFVNDTDVVCSWGRYATRIFAASGGYLPKMRVDLRQVGRQLLKGKVGTIEEFLRQIAATPSADLARGRAGQRAAQIHAVTRHYVDVAKA
jgi:DTW domain-containing protein